MTASEVQLDAFSLLCLAFQKFTKLSFSEAALTQCFTCTLVFFTTDLHKHCLNNIQFKYFCNVMLETVIIQRYGIYLQYYAVVLELFRNVQNVLKYLKTKCEHCQGEKRCLRERKHRYILSQHILMLYYGHNFRQGRSSVVDWKRNWLIGAVQLLLGVLICIPNPKGDPPPHMRKRFGSPGLHAGHEHTVTYNLALSPPSPMCQLTLL